MPSFTKDEPVIVVAAAGAAVSYVGSALVAHGVIGDATLTSVEQTAVPIVAAGFVLLLGVIARSLVAPYAKVKRLMEQAGLLSDTDFARMEALLDDKFGVELTPDDDPTAVEGPTGPVPDGMTAGAQVTEVPATTPGA
jgi:hypothetical protein